MVSHDRRFLDNIVDKIWEVEEGKVSCYRGNYSSYLSQVFGALVPQLLIGYIYGAIVHGFASENCSRMAAMESATRSADKMIEQLTQRYHTVRQLTITNELSDIIGAANAANEAQSAERASQAEVYRT